MAKNKRRDKFLFVAVIILVVIVIGIFIWNYATKSDVSDEEGLGTFGPGMMQLPSTTQTSPNTYPNTVPTPTSSTPNYNSYCSDPDNTWNDRKNSFLKPTQVFFMEKYLSTYPQGVKYYTDACNLTGELHEYFCTATNKVDEEIVSCENEFGKGYRCRQKAILTNPPINVGYCSNNPNCKDCSELNSKCGLPSNGCGGYIYCGECSSGQICVQGKCQ